MHEKKGEKIVGLESEPLMGEGTYKIVVGLFGSALAFGLAYSVIILMEKIFYSS